MSGIKSQNLSIIKSGFRSETFCLFGKSHEISLKIITILHPTLLANSTSFLVSPTYTISASLTFSVFDKCFNASSFDGKPLSSVITSAKYGLSSKEFCDYVLDEARVAIVPGDAFGQLGEGHVRFAYTISYENIEKGMEKVKSALGKL